jgi:hypothetical protein
MAETILQLTICLNCIKQCVSLRIVGEMNRRMIFDLYGENEWGEPSPRFSTEGKMATNF